jgi:diaminohydroxyphosphoribosylaminopyrimidine deaminase / 5-amino-6-(5-phosphoribosylamino)uracil reductase
VVERDSIDERYMRRALFHAARGQGRTTPNPMVGAVIVSRDGVIVGEGWHARAGEPHAEANALDTAGERARHATMYVTLEPCCHTGRTGPCTTRIIAAGITRVVAAMQDPDVRVAGRGFAELRAHGINVREGVSHDAARRLNRAFVSTKTLGRPLVIFKTALSLDGCVAEAAGQRTSITSTEANLKSQLLRASVDAIAVGSGTMLADDPLLTVRDCHRLRPLIRVIFDRQVRTPPTARLFSTLDQGPVIILAGDRGDDAMTRAARLEALGATIVKSDALRHSLGTLLRWEVSTLLVEGGPSLHAALAREGLVDAVHMIVAPRLLGARGVKWLDVETLPPSSLEVTRAEPRGVDTWIEADVHRDR